MSPRSVAWSPVYIGVKSTFEEVYVIDEIESVIDTRPKH